MTPSPHRSSLGRWLAKPSVGWALCGVGLAALLGTAAFAVRPAPAQADADRPGLRIAVETRREPTPEPGDILEVGVLRDDLDPASLAAARARPDPYAALPLDAADVDEEIIDDADVDAPAPAPPEYRGGGRVILIPPPGHAEPPRRYVVGRPEAFGFDEPRPDYVAERRARREMMERRMAQAPYRDPRYPY